MVLQASTAASEWSFSKAGLIVAAKRMVMTPANVDRLSLVRWYMQHQGWEDRCSKRRKRGSTLTGLKSTARTLRRTAVDIAKCKSKASARSRSKAASRSQSKASATVRKSNPRVPRREACGRR